ncbi:MAG TPA: hypothetical protein DCR16_00945 [Lachnospiraceae bacterium]|nr:hypothetical protein [Lachnospiraceae bacterium]
MSKRAILTTRQKSIIRILTRMDGRPITVAVISEKLGVSTRTILREVPAIEKWMSDNDFNFERKPGVGMLVGEAPETLRFIEELLDADNLVPMYSRQERRKHILGELLFSDEPVKSLVFTSKYKISDGTLSEDLDVLDTWLRDYSVQIIRRPGLGIFVEGTELAIRQAISNAVLEFCDVERIPGLITQGTSDDEKMQSLSREPLLVFLTPQLLRFSIRILKETEARLNICYTDSGQIALIVRIALSIYRIRSGHSLTELNMDLDGLRGLSELPTAKLIAFEIEKQFDLEVNAKEKIYLAMHLSATRILSRGSSFSDPLQALNIRQVVMAMTSVAEQLTGIPFKSDSTLINDLVSHISMTEKQLELNLVSRVTYTEDLKRTYPEIYAAAETACEVLREWVQPRVIHDAEIGLIAMHFAASAERYQNSKQKVSVAVVCPTGIGSSRMLAATLTGAFHNLEVRKVISAFSIDTQALRENGIDLIISTTDLHIDFPYIVVEKVLKAQDKLLVSQEIDRIGKEKLQKRMQQGGRRSLPMNVDDIQRTSEIGTEIVEILNHFRVVRQPGADNIRHMMELAAAVFADGEEDVRRLADCFQEREKLGATYIPDMEICLFHGASDLVAHSRFGFLVLDTPLTTTETMIRGAVIMVVPASFKDSYRVEPAGRLSALLVEDERFLQALQRGDEAAGFNLAREALVKYFQHVIRQQ